MRAFALFVLVLLASPPHARSAEPPSPAATPSGAAERVNFVFAWLPGLETVATSTRTRTRRRGGEEGRGGSMTVSYRMTVEPEGEDLRIRFGEPRLEDIDSFGEDLPEVFRSAKERSGGRMAMPVPAPVQALAQYAHLVPDYVVATTGEFVRLYDLPKFQATIREMFRRTTPEERHTEVMARMEETLTSEVFVTAQVTQLWDGIVALWAGEELEVGRRYTNSGTGPAEPGETGAQRVEAAEPELEQTGSEQRAQAPRPLLGGDLALTEYSLSIEESLPCYRDGANRRCVEIVLRTSPHSFLLKLFAESLGSRFSSGLPPGEAPALPVPETLEMTNEVKVLTEPDGLIPHAYTMTKIVKGSSTETGVPEELTDTLEVRYAYR